MRKFNFLLALSLLFAAFGLRADTIVEGVSFSDCESHALLGKLNDSELGPDAWDAVRSRAVNQVFAFKYADLTPEQIESGIFNPINSLDRLGRIRQVGPATLEQFRLVVAPTCEVEVIVEPDLEVVFSPATSDESHLMKVKSWLGEAESSIDIAMYSMRYTSAKILDELEKAINERNVKVRMIFEKANSDRRKSTGGFSAVLEQRGIDVRYVNKIMHHKFALIDARPDDANYAPKLITGSANWTGSAASRYDENTVFYRGDDSFINFYRWEFDLLWNNSRDFININFEKDISPEIANPYLPENNNASDFDLAFTSQNFRVYDSSRYGATFSVDRTKNTVADKIVEAIAQAETSIYVATGHLRSKAIADALLNAKQANPQLDVKVYLDNQEYISSWYQAQQVSDQNTCVENARTENQVAACYDKGFYYSYEIAQSNIELKFKSYAFRWHYSYAPQMHHKYVIIDEKLVITGSYNFSDNAEHNTMENVIFINAERNPVAVQDFVTNFNAMFVTNRDALTGLRATIATNAIIPIVFDAMALNYDELTALKDLIKDNCDDIYSDDFRKSPENHRVCYR